jgi:hypothetical protein
MGASLHIPEEAVRVVLDMPSLPQEPDDPARVNGKGGNIEYQRYIKSQECLGCQRMGEVQEYPSEHHHALNPGTALRCPDEYAIPLCHECHGMLHGLDRGGKRTFLRRTNLPNYYGPIAFYLASYAYACNGGMRSSEKARRRAVFYFNRLYEWLQTETAQILMTNQPAATRLPTASPQ